MLYKGRVSLIRYGKVALLPPRILLVEVVSQTDHQVASFQSLTRLLLGP